ncbi:MAG: 3'-5' exonuclease [Acutalibacteraceae bacterium]
MTVHSAKGLEFPYVFLPGFEDGLTLLARAGQPRERGRGAPAGLRRHHARRRR